MPLDERAFRDALGCFATGVTVVTMRTPGGQPHGLTVNSFTSVSLDPPLVLVCVDRRQPSHDVIAAAEGWLVNVLAADQEELSRRFANPDIDRFDGLHLTDGPFGAPRLPGCIAYVAVRSHDSLAAGDHSIFVGEAVEAEVTGGAPLLFFRGGYGV